MKIKLEIDFGNYPVKALSKRNVGLAILDCARALLLDDRFFDSGYGEYDIEDENMLHVCTISALEE